MPSEEKWYARTGRFVDAKVEADGDIHLALEDATGNNVGTVSAEIAVGPKWCEIRQTVFSWTTQKFRFSVKTAHALKFRKQRCSLTSDPKAGHSASKLSATYQPIAHQR